MPVFFCWGIFFLKLVLPMAFSSPENIILISISHFTLCSTLFHLIPHYHTGFHWPHHPQQYIFLSLSYSVLCVLASPVVDNEWMYWDCSSSAPGFLVILNPQYIEVKLPSFFWFLMWLFEPTNSGHYLCSDYFITF